MFLTTEFEEFFEIMAAATGSPPELWRNLSSATVLLIPVELPERDPRAIITELIGQPPPPSAPDCTRR
jgi:hypothetical protein